MPISRCPRMIGPALALIVIGLASLFLEWSPSVQAFAPKNLEFVSSLGGKTTSVAISGTVVFAGQGYSLASLDVSDPAHIAFLSNAPLPDFAVRVQISGTNAYVADGAGGLQIVDIADPLHLQWRGSYAINGKASDVAVVGNRAYIAAHSSSDTFLQIFDVTNPASPASLGTYSLGYAGQYAAVDVAGSTAFIGDRIGLTVVDGGDPVHPAKLGGLTLPGGAADIRVTGDRIVTVGQRNLPERFELDVIDAHTPMSPTLVGNYLSNYPAGSGPSLDVAGDIAYVGGVEQGLALFDLTIPTTPTLKKSLPYTAVDIKVIGSRGFLASHNEMLQVVDFNAELSSSLVGEFELYTTIFDVRLRSPYAFTADYAQILRVVDTSNPQSPVVIAAGPFPGYGQDVILAGNYAYINRFNYGVDIFNITNPASPVPLASYNRSQHGSYTAIAVDGNYAYVGELGGGIHLLDVTNPASPQYISTVSLITGSVTQAMKRVGNTLYIAAGNAGLIMADVADVAHPNVSGRAGGLWAAGLDITKNWAFVSASGDGVYVFDISNPMSPTVVAKYPTGNISLGNVLAAGQLVFVAELWKGLLILDVSNPSTPKLYQEYPIGCEMRGLDVRGDYIYLACGRGGLRIFRLPGISALTESQSFLPLISK